MVRRVITIFPASRIFYLPARIKRRISRSPKVAITPDTWKVYNREKGGGSIAGSILAAFRLDSPSPPLARSNVCRFTTRKRGRWGDRGLCITFTHNVVCQQPSLPRENVIPSRSRTFRGLMFARFIGRATHRTVSITKGMARSVFFFFFLFTFFDVCVYDRGRALNGDSFFFFDGWMDTVESLSLSSPLCSSRDFLSTIFTSVMFDFAAFLCNGS